MSTVKKEMLFRIILIYIGVMALGLTVIGRAIYVQITEGSELKKRGKKNIETSIIVEPTRGDILAIDGRVLATSLPSYDIRMDTRAKGMTDKLFNTHIDSLALCLAQVPGKKTAQAYKQLIWEARQKNNKYLLVERQVDYLQLKQIKRYPLFRMGSNKGGLIVEQGDIRKQPHNGLAGRTIGYLTKEPNGNFPGLEGAYDVYLRGEPGVGVVQVLPGGGKIPVGGANSVEPKDGGDIVSTIDVNIQDVAETSLRKCLNRHNAHHGSVVVMEVATGEVKAIVNLGVNAGGGYSEMYNYALGEAVEPGSTFKLMSYMAAFEDGYIQPEDTVNNGNGSVFFYGKRVHDDGRKITTGNLTVEQAFAHSSNVSITKIINRHYKGKEKQFIDRLYAMNLNQRLGLELSGEGEPEIKYPGSKYWSGLSLTQMAYGYEVLLAPIHTLTFYNAVANNGKMVKPRFVKEFRRHGALDREQNVTVIKSSIASISTIRKVKKMMEAAVEYGTAKNIHTNYYPIAGKTGTAQIANGKYGFGNVKRHYASFVGYFPADRPKYSCIVTVYAPQNGTSGGTVSAPVFREIADKIYAADFDMQETLKPEKRGITADIPYSKSGFYDELYYVFKELEIPVVQETTKSKWVNATGEKDAVTLERRTVANNLVPNVVDMGLKDALFLLEQRGLQVSVRGRGRIVSQSLAPGSDVHKNRTITLEMSR
ncbi:MAG: transpeptidase family protein [Bacteroidales bacterium]|jgi:cell division protein FtsI (penicillin-binding protein 3)|nr:transpeptidase family protein [Bacteroidales bacterium]